MALKTQDEFTSMRRLKKKNIFARKRVLRALGILTHVYGVKRFIPGFFLWLAALAFLTMICGGYALYQGWTWYQGEPWDEQIEKILQYQKPVSTKFYDASGKLVGEDFSAFHQFVSLEKIPQTLIDAVLAIEDKNFFSHSGLDLSAIMRAAWHNFRQRQITQGGSTITQQLVRHHLLNRQKKYSRKLKEVILSWKLERRLDKNQILEMYLNHLFLGQNSYGVQSAALRFFSKPIQALTLHEQAFIAGLFQAPSRYNPLRNKDLARKRQVSVLKALYRYGKISEQRFRQAIKRPLRYRPMFSGAHETASHHRYYLDYARMKAQSILGESDLKDKGYKIYTYLNQEVSNIAAESVARMSSKFEKVEELNGLGSDDLEAAVTVMNVQNGTIEAMIGGRSYEKSEFNRSYQAQRAPGSIFKPVIYSYALSQGYRWSDVFYLAPITLGDTYRPKSSKSEYLSETTLLRAFTSSINVTTIEVGKKLGITKVIDHAKKLGINSPIKKEFGSLIGQSEVSGLDMLRLYSTFANAGKTIEPVVISHIKDAENRVVYRAEDVATRSESVLTEKINFLMVKAMSSVLRHGTGRTAANLSHIAAGKTGTTNESVDNWFCGFTLNYLTVVWVGSDSYRALLRGRSAGATLALPIWSYTMEKLVAKNRPPPFSVPEGVRRYTIDSRYGHKTSSGYEAWFLSQHAPPQQPSLLKLLSTSGKVLRGFGSGRK